MSALRRIGPGLLVTAAFIGPGTVTTASKAGAGFGFALLWAVLFSVLATIILQEMAARLGIVSRQGLGEAVRSTFPHPAARFLACGLIVAAIGFGNAAYQTGNVTGAAIGLAALTPYSLSNWAIAVGLAAFGLLATGVYKLIERVLIALVVLMSGLFVYTAVIVRPDLGDVFAGAFVPRIPDGSLMTVLALIGTTIVPYNLFLHAASVREHWPETVPRDRALAEARIDTVLAVAIGGAITAAIVITAAAAFFPGGSIGDAADMARQLEPALGRHATLLFSAGLFAAGLTSAVTAPLAAAYAVAGALGWPIDLKSWRFRGVWFAVLATGTTLAATLGGSPAETIVAAQVANGFLLPLIAVFLLAAVNRRGLMGGHANGVVANVLGAAVLVVVVLVTVATRLPEW
ncbi:MAG: Nramp family divalent metal transporter [Planctomycetaceae bacterium]